MEKMCLLGVNEVWRTQFRKQNDVFVLFVSERFLFFYVLYKLSLIKGA